MITKCQWDNQVVIILPFIQLRNKRMQKLMKFHAVAQLNNNDKQTQGVLYLPQA